MPTLDARLAMLEEAIRGVREDVSELVAEMNRTRGRLHDLEGIAQVFVDTQKVNRQREEDQYRRLGLRIQVLTLILGAAAVIVPIVTILLATK